MGRRHFFGWWRREGALLRVGVGVTPEKIFGVIGAAGNGKQTYGAPEHR
jgi:ABC-type oligopeptide transport system ATPase subunit